MTADFLCLSEVLCAMRDDLDAAGIAEPMREACYLAQTTTGYSACRNDTRIDRSQATQLMALAHRRVSGEPVSRIRGWRDFWTHRVLLDEAVLDPRPDSETLVEAALDLLPADSDGVVWDIGCGSGCLAASILGERPNMTGLATDISPAALANARLNLHRAGVLDRCMLAGSNWYDSLDGQADVIIANPPYVASDRITSLSDEIRLFDPHVALDGGKDGLCAYRPLAAGARDHLNSGGALAVEIGDGQLDQVISIFTSAGLCDIRQWSDLGGIVRVVAGHTGNHRA